MQRKVTVESNFLRHDPILCVIKQLFIRGLPHMKTTKRIKRRAVLASRSVSESNALHTLLSMSHDFIRFGEKTLSRATLEKRCMLDKYVKAVDKCFSC